MSDNLFELYSQKILAYATQSVRTEAIVNANAHAKLRSPICGSEIEVQIQVEDNIIRAYSQTVRACALGQASSAIFAAQVVGVSLGQLQTLRGELNRFLKGEGSVPSLPFEAYSVLEPAQGHANRHASILLPVDTTLKAFETVK